MTVASNHREAVTPVFKKSRANNMLATSQSMLKKYIYKERRSWRSRDMRYSVACLLPVQNGRRAGLTRMHYKRYQKTASFAKPKLVTAAAMSGSASDACKNMTHRSTRPLNGKEDGREGYLGNFECKRRTT